MIPITETWREFPVLHLKIKRMFEVKSYHLLDLCKLIGMTQSSISLFALLIDYIDLLIHRLFESTFSKPNQKLSFWTWLWAWAWQFKLLTAPLDSSSQWSPSDWPQSSACPPWRRTCSRWPPSPRCTPSAPQPCSQSCSSLGSRHTQLACQNRT